MKCDICGKYADFIMVHATKESICFDCAFLLVDCDEYGGYYYIYDSQGGCKEL